MLKLILALILYFLFLGGIFGLIFEIDGFLEDGILVMLGILICIPFAAFLVNFIFDRMEKFDKKQ